jgi:hypothetical protein
MNVKITEDITLLNKLKELGVFLLLLIYSTRTRYGLPGTCCIVDP